MLKKVVTSQAIIAIVCLVLMCGGIVGIICGVAGVSIGVEAEQRYTIATVGSGAVINNQIYADKYIPLLNKYLKQKGYVSLERIVYYLQRTRNVLDTSLLSNDDWEQAYLANVFEDYYQMVPIRTLCKNLKFDETLPEYTVESGETENGIYIEALDLCNVDGEEVATSKAYTENPQNLFFSFPLKDDFSVSSFVFSNRNIDLPVDKQKQEIVNYHTGWDFAVPIGTEFYSVCSGKIKRIVDTQDNDYNFNQQTGEKNTTGNFIEVECYNGVTVGYYHIKYHSAPYNLYLRNATVSRGDLLGKTSTTGMSTGPHLHLEMTNEDGIKLDALDYIDFSPDLDIEDFYENRNPSLNRRGN